MLLWDERLTAEIEKDATSERAGVRRFGVIDRAWWRLHGGLRVGEVRRLQLADVDLDGQRLRIVQSKGMMARWPPTSEPPLMTTGQMVTLVDGLSQGTLNERQRELIHTLRSGLVFQPLLFSYGWVVKVQTLLTHLR